MWKTLKHKKYTKVAILPKLTYRFKTIPIKYILITIFTTQKNHHHS